MRSFVSGPAAARSRVSILCVFAFNQMSHDRM